MLETRMTWLAEGTPTHFELTLRAMSLDCLAWVLLDADALKSGQKLPKPAENELPYAIFWLDTDENLYYVGKIVKAEAGPA